MMQEMVTLPRGFFFFRSLPTREIGRDFFGCSFFFVAERTARFLCECISFEAAIFLVSALASIFSDFGNSGKGNGIVYLFP